MSQLQTSEARNSGLTLQKVKSHGSFKVLVAYVLAVLIFIAGQIISPASGNSPIL